MRVRDIPIREWRPFFDRLGREHRAWLATVERGGLVQAREEPLRSVSAAGDIEIRVGDQAIRVSEPRAVRVEETDEGFVQAVHVEDGRRGQVTLRFRIAAALGELDGLAPAER